MSWSAQARLASAQARRLRANQTVARRSGHVGLNTRSFVTSHAREPKGYGRWGFAISGRKTNRTVWMTGNYGTAKKSAVSLARRVSGRTSGYSMTVKVLP